MVKAGQIYRCGRRRIRVEQVRGTKEGGLRYALVRFIGRQSKYLKSREWDYPITVQLMPDGSMPPGYSLATGRGPTAPVSD